MGWEYAGIGWANRGEFWFADTQRLRRADERRMANEEQDSVPESSLADDAGVGQEMGARP
jgi:hypothetical protein